MINIRYETDHFKHIWRCGEKIYFYNELDRYGYDRAGTTLDREETKTLAESCFCFFCLFIR